MPVGPFRTFTHGVNVSSLAARFEAGAEVTPEALLAARVLRTLRHPVKILGDGEISVALTVHAHRFSASARQKIEAAGGTAQVIEIPSEPLAALGVEAPADAPAAKPAKAPKAPKASKAEPDAEAPVAAEAAPEAEEAPAADVAEAPADEADAPADNG